MSHFFQLANCLYSAFLFSFFLQNVGFTGIAHTLSGKSIGSIKHYPENIKWHTFWICANILNQSDRLTHLQLFFLLQWSLEICHAGIFLCIFHAFNEMPKKTSLYPDVLWIDLSPKAVCLKERIISVTICVTHTLIFTTFLLQLFLCVAFFLLSIFPPAKGNSYPWPQHLSYINH